MGTRGDLRPPTDLQRPRGPWHTLRLAARRLLVAGLGGGHALDGNRVRSSQGERAHLNGACLAGGEHAVESIRPLGPASGARGGWNEELAEIVHPAGDHSRSGCQEQRREPGTEPRDLSPARTPPRLDLNRLGAFPNDG